MERKICWVRTQKGMGNRHFHKNCKDRAYCSPEIFINTISLSEKIILGCSQSAVGKQCFKFTEHHIPSTSRWGSLPPMRSFWLPHASRMGARRDCTQPVLTELPHTAQVIIHSVDRKCPPKAPALKAFPPNTAKPAVIGSWWCQSTDEFSWVGHSWRRSVTEGALLKDTSCPIPPSFPLSLSASLPGCQGVSSYAPHACSILMSASSRTAVTEAANYSLNPWAMINPRKAHSLPHQNSPELSCCSQRYTQIETGCRAEVKTKRIIRMRFECLT